MSTSDDLIRTGDLEGARVALVEAVRSDPADARARLALAELLMVLGDYERADTHLDAAQGLDVGFGMPVALSRQLVRAATWRRDTFDTGRPPELVTEPTPAIDAALAAVLAERDGAADTIAADKASEQEAVLAAIAGTIDERPFLGWRDADDRTAGILELLTSTGKYVWVPLVHVRGVALRPVERLRDVIWRPAEIDIADGPTGVVYLPVIYHAPTAEMTADHRLGRATDWHDGARTRGLGLRTWLIGDDAVAPADFTALRIAG